MRKKSKECVLKILEKGASPIEPNNQGVTPLVLAGYDQEMIKILNEHLKKKQV